ncbi:hypothetical protein AB0N20_27490 [Streptomyces griseoincarnatus]
MSQETEQQRAARAYQAGRENRDQDNVQRANDNARIGGANGAGAGGAR